MPNVKELTSVSHTIKEPEETEIVAKMELVFVF